MLDILDGLASEPIVEVLDTLLWVFIVVELLAAVRTTVAKRELVAEPFLLVGIIAAIKEIVMTAAIGRPTGYAEGPETQCFRAFQVVAGAGFEPATFGL